MLLAFAFAVMADPVFSVAMRWRALFVPLAVTVAARGRDQELVIFDAAAVFVAFHADLVAMCRFSWQQRWFGSLAINLAGAGAVSFTLVINVARGDPIISIAAAVIIAGARYVMWVKFGRPADSAAPPLSRTNIR